MNALFRDRESAPNLCNGREFHAAGIVLESHDPNGSGKDLAVMYFSPFDACFERAWRSTDEVELYPVDVDTWTAIRAAYKQSN